MNNGSSIICIICIIFPIFDAKFSFDENERFNVLMIKEIKIEIETVCLFDTPADVERLTNRIGCCTRGIIVLALLA